MKINFNVNVVNFAGEIIKNDKGEDLKIKDIIISLLLNKKDLNESEKYKYFLLCKKIYDDENDYTIDEIRLILDEIKNLNVYLYGFIYEYINKHIK